MKQDFLTANNKVEGSIGDENIDIVFLGRDALYIIVENEYNIQPVRIISKSLLNMFDKTYHLIILTSRTLDK